MQRGHNRRGFAITGLALAAMVAVMPASPAWALKADESRIKDLAFLEGTSPEPLVGYGLVIGLNGTGDSPKAGGTSNSLATLLESVSMSRWRPATSRRRTWPR
jgi:flagellar P-ring protein precursor FlgI